jgi:hypothetical protein
MKEPLNETSRFLFIKKRNIWSSPWVRTAKYTFIFAVLLSLVGFSFTRYTHNVYQEGFLDGRKHALDIRNPSDELDLACAALWIGYQHYLKEKKEK